MNTKTIPAIITLIAGFITCLMAFLTQMDLMRFAKIFLAVVVGFYILGCIVKVILDKSFKAPEEVTAGEPGPEEGQEEAAAQAPDAETDKMNENEM